MKKQTMAIIWPCLILAVLGTRSIAQEAQDPLAFTHVTVIDGTGSPPQPDMTVVVVDGRIDALGGTDEAPIPGGATVIDGTGRFMIPGLWDMHIHDRVYGWPLLVASGVTGVRMMLGNASRLELRDQIASGTVHLPHIHLASPVFSDVPRAVNPEDSEWYQLSTPEEAREAVRTAKEAGYDLIKVGSNLRREHYLAIVDEASQQGIPFAGHLPYSVSPGEASDNGQRSLEHFWDMTVGCSSRAAQLQMRRADAWNLDLIYQVEADAWNSYDPDVAAALCQKFISNDTWLCPTLALQQYRGHADDSAFAVDPRLQHLPQWQLELWNDARDKTWLPRVDDERKKLEIFLALVGVMHEAGVRFLAGTDMGNPYCHPEMGVQDELELLVQAGFSPLAALQTATRNPAEYMGRLDDLGTVEEGKIADLVLLHADPLSDIRNARQVDGVVLHGRWYSASTLDRIIDDAKRTAHIEGLGGRWRRDWTRPGYPVTYTWLAACTLANETVDTLTELNQLEHLNLRATEVTDTELAELATLSKLKRLFLGDTNISDSGIEHVATLTDLELLRLENTTVTDTALRSIAGLSKLTQLDVRNTRVTDAGVSMLQESLPQLEIRR